MGSKIAAWINAIAGFFQIASYWDVGGAAIISVVSAVLSKLGDVQGGLSIGLAVLVFFVVLVPAHYLAVRFWTIPLSDAARRAYEELRDTLWGDAAERLGVDTSPNGILDYMGTAIADQVPIFGKRPPSTKLERIDERRLRSGSFQGGAEYLQMFDAHGPQYKDLTVRRGDARKAIRQMAKIAAACENNK